MKRIIGLFLPLFFCSTLAWGQMPVMQKFANGANIGASTHEVSNTNRITLKVEDIVPFSPGMVYEFGAVNAYKWVDGQRTFIRKFRDSEVVNGPVMNFVVGAHYHPDLTGAIELEVEWIKRYDLNNTVTTLAIDAEGRTLRLEVKN